MGISAKRIAITVAAGVVGLGIGLWIGSSFGFNAGASTVATVSINTLVHDLDNRLEALQAMRQQDPDTSIEALEHGLDRDIVSLLPSHREGLRIPKPTLEFAEKGLERAKRYRAEFPRASQGRPIDDDVERALSAVD